ncbi:MAG TPA: ADOP family duplicated permease [Blastocatellia bacterium]|nr:ADOP family duplicated permease [Blastocatellia bacterium]
MRYLHLDQTFQDLKFAFRQIRQHPTFSAVIILTLSLGIGANIAIFNLLNAVLLRQLPVKRADELVLISPVTQQGQKVGLTYELFEQFQRKQQALAESYGASYPETIEMGQAPENGKARVQLVSGDFFSVLTAAPYLGRLITRADDDQGGLVGVLSYQTWAQTYNKNPQILGQTIYLDRQPITVIGVAQAQFFGDVPGERIDVWIPLKLHSRIYHTLLTARNSSDFAFIHVVGRARMPEETMKASFALTLKQMLAEIGVRNRESSIEPARFEILPAGNGVSSLRTRLSTPLIAMMVLAALLLLLTCLNISNLLLARVLSRGREFATRLAIGAATGQIIRQLAIENLLLSLLSGSLGFLAGSWISSLLSNWLGTADAVATLNLHSDLRVLLFGLGLSFSSGIIFSLIPVYRVSRIDLMSVLRDGAPQQRRRFGRLLIISQISITFILLFEAGLFIKTLWNLEHLDPGFVRQNLLQVEIDVKRTGLTGESLTALYRDLSEKLKALPGVRATGWALFNLSGGESGTFCCLSAPGRSSLAPGGKKTNFNIVLSRYFESVGMRLLAGRDFNETEADRHHAVMINQTLAKKLFGSSPPVGQRILYTNAPAPPADLEVVGVVADARDSGLRDEPTEMLYFPLDQPTDLVLRYVYLRTDHDPQPIIKTVLSLIREANPNLAVLQVETIDQILDRELVRERLIARVTSAVAFIALALATVGLYGSIYYSVDSRNRELAIRLALGALRYQIIWLVLREIIWVLGTGFLIGTLTASGIARLIESLLYGLSATNAAMMLLVVAVMTFAALGASIVPLRRAMGIKPLSILRHE